MNDPLYVVFQIVVNFALWLIFIRFLMQFADIEKKHPYAVATYRLSAVVDVFARIFPNVGKGRISTSALVLLLLLWFIDIAGTASILGKQLTALQLFFAGTMTAISAFLTGLKWVILASVITSFIVMFAQKIHPVIDVIMQLATPLIEPFRKISPDLGMIDLAPLIAMLCFSFMATFTDIMAKHFWQMIS